MLFYAQQSRLYIEKESAVSLATAQLVLTVVVVFFVGVELFIRVAGRSVHVSPFKAVAGIWARQHFAIALRVSRAVTIVATVAFLVTQGYLLSQNISFVILPVAVMILISKVQVYLTHAAHHRMVATGKVTNPWMFSAVISEYMLSKGSSPMAVEALPFDTEEVLPNFIPGTIFVYVEGTIISFGVDDLRTTMLHAATLGMPSPTADWFGKITFGKADTKGLKLLTVTPTLYVKPDGE